MARGLRHNEYRGIFIFSSRNKNLFSPVIFWAKATQLKIPEIFSSECLQVYSTQSQLQNNLGLRRLVVILHQ